MSDYTSPWSDCAPSTPQLSDAFTIPRSVLPAVLRPNLVAQGLQVGLKGRRIGTGGRGRQHLRFFAGIEGAHIAAVCDVNQKARGRAAAIVRQEQGHAPREYADMRKLFEDQEVQAVSVATPNHWHALTTIWACQAGKYKRMVQVGSQSQSIRHKREAMAKLREGVIGKVHMACGLCFRRCHSIGTTPAEPGPPGLDWDNFLGPAPMRPYTKNRFDYTDRVKSRVIRMQARIYLQSAS